MENSKSISFNKTSESVHLGILLAAAGGFLDAYTYICRGGVFANAETGNIVLVGLAITEGNIIKAVSALLPIISFILGALLALYIKDSTSSIKLFHPNHAILAVEILVLVIIGFIPTTVPHIFVTTTISFVSSLQIASFRKLRGSAFSTTMCTGNLRSACEFAYKSIKLHTKEDQIKLIHYTAIILSFTFGAVLGGFFTYVYDYKSIWVSALILTIGLCTFNFDLFYNNLGSKKTNI